MKPKDLIGKTIKHCEYKILRYDSNCDFLYIEFTDDTSILASADRLGKIFIESTKETEQYFEDKLITKK